MVFIKIFFKVEFYQPSCWLYFVPNLLVFQQLVTLYLGVILVRVVSEILWRNAQECARKQGLVTGSHGWLVVASRQKLLMCQACQKLKRHANWSTTRQNRTTGCLITSRLELVTQSGRESKPRANPVLKNLTLHIPFSPQYKYPFYPRKRAYKENFEKETLEKNKIDSSPIFIKKLFKYLNSLPLHC